MSSWGAGALGDRAAGKAVSLSRVSHASATSRLPQSCLRRRLWRLRRSSSSSSAASSSLSRCSLAARRASFLSRRSSSPAPPFLGWG
jgi:hypothetical protein